MGYSYCARTGRLACDGCGATDGKTRKRTCPHKVHYAEGGSLPYCYPAALCPACYAKHKPTLHKDCAAGAAAATAREVAKAAKLTAGELEVRSAFGDWCYTVPDGFVGVFFRGANRIEVPKLVPEADYDPGNKRWLSDYPTATDWKGLDATFYTKRDAAAAGGTL